MKNSNGLNHGRVSVGGDARFGIELVAELCGRSLPLPVPMPGTALRILEVTIKNPRAFAVKIRRMNEWQFKG